jgi:hypothetical protein
LNECGIATLLVKEKRNVYVRSACLEIYVSTLIKKKIKFSSYREIQSGVVAKSYMRKGFLYMRKCANISPYMRRPLIMYDFATAPL